MGSKSQILLNPQALFEDEEHEEASTQHQMEFFSFPSNFNVSHLPSIPQHQTLSPSTPFLHPNLSQTLNSSHFPTPHLLSLQTSTPNPWAFGKRNEYHLGLGVSTMKMKRMKGRRKVREPRFSFKTMTDVDVLDDGYKWRKYGQKVVKNTHHPRSYYRCTQDDCRVKKRVERLDEDPRMVITTYEGRHIHSPSHDTQHSEPHTHLNNFFW
ncbi:probable WRKY transcription factor 13 [Cucurbita pepo subsp. pepo]|uniref:probable WRKY transcription factor 13 n=1 Tax=Cucurbita pepo subsp. pepo TaxID=3664 RepID=UPI000C9D3514|nr:probable WRKY transcription factor 13 [Cucurbita pepo subsp. pepo]